MAGEHTPRIGGCDPVRARRGPARRLRSPHGRQPTSPRACTRRSRSSTSCSAEEEHDATLVPAVYGRRRARARHGRRVQRADPRRARLPVAAGGRPAGAADAKAEASAAPGWPRAPLPVGSLQRARRGELAVCSGVRRRARRARRPAPRPRGARPSTGRARRAARAAGRRRRRAARGRRPRSPRRGRRRARRAGSRRGPRPRRRPPRRGSRDRRGRTRRRTRAGWRRARRPRRGRARPRSAATRIAAETSVGEALGPDERHAQLGGALLGRAADRGGGDVVVGEAGAAQRVGGRGRPDHLVERALDALGGEVRERAGEIEEELRARSLALPSRPRLRSASLRSDELDHVAHLSSLGLKSGAPPWIAPCVPRNGRYRRKLARMGSRTHQPSGWGGQPMARSGAVRATVTPCRGLFWPCPAETRLD